MTIEKNPTVKTGTENVVKPTFIDIPDILDFNQFLRKNVPEQFTPKLTPLEIPISGKLVYTKQATLTRKSGYYIIPQAGDFYYLKIGNVVPNGEHLFKIEGKGPPLLREGMIVIEKEVYYVTLEDIKRGVIRKSRKLKLKRGTITYDDFLNGTTAPIEKPTTTKATTKQRKVAESGNGDGTGETGVGKAEEGGVSDFPIADRLNKTENPKLKRISKDLKLDESEAADLVIEEEMRALLHYSSEKEGTGGEDWEVEEDSQP
jgi:hypothetical protein